MGTSQQMKTHILVHAVALTIHDFGYADLSDLNTTSQTGAASWPIVSVFWGRVNCLLTYHNRGLTAP